MSILEDAQRLFPELGIESADITAAGQVLDWPAAICFNNAAHGTVLCIPKILPYAKDELWHQGHKRLARIQQLEVLAKLKGLI